MLSKGSKLYSIFGFKCPKCHEGDLYETNTWSFQKPFDMPAHCDHCGQTYMPEPGFYYGAMFLSYIVSAWISLGFIFLFHWVFKWGLGPSFALMIFLWLVFFVWFFRFSRALWINITVKYDPGAANAEK